MQANGIPSSTGSNNRQAARLAQVAALNKMTGLRAIDYAAPTDPSAQGDLIDFVTIRFNAVAFDQTQLTPERLRLAAAVCNARHVAIELLDLDKVERVAITAAELDPLKTARDYPGIPVGPCFAKLWPVRVGEALVRVLS
jgi:hypothetical protein